MRDLATGTIGAELFSDTDFVFEAEQMPDNTSVTSDAFPFGETLHGLELVGTVPTQISLADTTTLTITGRTSDTRTGTFTEAVTLYTKTASGAETIAANTELFRYVADTEEKLWWQVRITTTDTQETGNITVYIASVKKD